MVNRNIRCLMSAPAANGGAYVKLHHLNLPPENLEFGILNPAGQRRRSYETSLEAVVFRRARRPCRADVNGTEAVHYIG